MLRKSAERNAEHKQHRENKRHIPGNSASLATRIPPRFQWRRPGATFSPRQYNRASYRINRILGRALETFYSYSSYEVRGEIDLRLFKEAVAIAPDSFMGQDLLGWAYYRNKYYNEAKASFLQALQANPKGAGAMSGLMWCGVFTKNREEALYWAERKAEMRQEDIEAAKQKVLNRFENAL